MTAAAKQNTLEESQGGWQRWFQPGRFLMLLGLAVFASYFDVIVAGNTFVTRDFAYFGYPLAHHHRQSFWNGEIPLWNPLNNCGLPFLAQWNTMVLYPGSLFYLLLPLSWSLGVFCLLHLMLGGLGMYFLAWKWTRHRVAACLAGMAFATNGLTLNSLMWPNNISALGWMPWVVLLAENGWSKGGRALRAAVVVGAMQMLTGAPEVILLTWVLICLLAVSHLLSSAPDRLLIVGRLAAAILLIAALAAAQLLPFLELLSRSQRDEGFFDSVWPMPGTGWANLLVPLFRCFSTSQGVYFQPNQYWTTSYYVGAGAVALALLAAVVSRDRRALVLLSVTVTGLVLALGNQGYLYPLLKQALPMIGFMRFPIKFVVWVIFALPLLAAFGVALLLSPAPRRGINTAKLTVGLALTVTALIGMLVWFAHAFPEKQEQWSRTAFSGLSRVAFLWGLVGLALLLRRNRPLRGSIVIGSAFVLLAGFDPMSYSHQKTPSAPRAAYDPHLVQLDPRPEPGQSRVITSYWAHQRFNRVSASSPLNDFLVKRLGLFANCNLLEGIPKLDGFYSLYLREPDAIWSIFYFQTNNNWITQALVSTNERTYAGLLDFMGAAYESGTEQYYEWTPRTNHLPMVTAGQTPVFADETTTLRGLVQRGFAPRREVFLPLEAKSVIEPSQTSMPELSASYSAHHIKVDISAKVPATVVIAQSFYRPWVAYLDGSPARIWRANFAFQALPVPAGSHVIELVYRDWRFIQGMCVSIVVFLWLAASSLRRRSAFPDKSSPPVMK